MPILLLLFIVVPAVELWLLWTLGSEFGLLTTIALILGTGVLGAALARWQGLQAIANLQAQMRQGMLPAQAIGDGVLIFVAGVLLITPGLLSDITGILLLIPPVRKLALQGLRVWLAKRVVVATRTAHANASGAAAARRSTVIDAKVIDARVVEPTEE